LPRAAAAGEEVWLRVEVGALPRGTQIRLATADGRDLAEPSVPPPTAGRHVVSLVPLPQSAVTGGQVTIRIEVEEPGKAARPPRGAEVQIEAAFVPVAR
jgi:hypothetical protein